MFQVQPDDPCRYFAGDRRFLSRGRRLLRSPLVFPGVLR